MQLKRLVFTAESQRFHQNIAATRGTEDGNPLHNAGGNEVREAGFIDSVATAHDGKVNETEFRQQVRSQSEIGNEGNNTARNEVMVRRTGSNQVFRLIVGCVSVDVMNVGNHLGDKLSAPWAHLRLRDDLLFHSFG